MSGVARKQAVADEAVPGGVDHADGDEAVADAAVATLDSMPRMPAADESRRPQYAPACATFRSFLRRHNLKFTPERAAVLDAVLRQPPLFDADMAVEAVRAAGHGGSRATVYRALGHMQEAGLLRQVVFGNGQAFFELAGDGRDHDYLVDVDTGEVIPFESRRLSAARDAVCRELGVEAVRHQLHIFVRRPGRKSLAERGVGDEGQ